jgi:hypothetical protein
MLKRKKILEYQVLSVSDFGGLQLWEIIQALQKYPEQARVSVDYPYEYSCDLMIKASCKGSSSRREKTPGASS